MKFPSWPTIKRLTLDILFPPVCLACEDFLMNEAGTTRGLCRICMAGIKSRDTLLCACCGARLPENVKTCHPKAAFILGAAADYENPVVRALIFRLKYERLRAASAPLQDLLGRYLSDLDFDWTNFMVIPVPLHPRRKRERGFNQAELLSQHVAELLRLPHETHALKRVRYEEPQAKIRTRAERELNMTGAFEADISIAKKNILLVDDVMTTGATLRAATEALKNAGARKIIALVVAKRN